VFLSQSRGLLPEEHRCIRLGRNKGKAEDASEEDEQDPVDPSPAVCADVDPSTEKRAKTWSHAKGSAVSEMRWEFSGVTYKMVNEKTAMGIPRSLASHISEMVPPTFVIGAEEAVPAI
jgi:hypothetical protein